MDTPLKDVIIVTCGTCGKVMAPAIEGPDEILYMCDPDACTGQVNVMTAARAAELDQANKESL